MYLLIDDVRDLEGMDIICRTAEAGIMIAKQCHITHLYLDHDLGCECLTGYDVINELIDAKCYIPYVQIVSSNPVGAMYIGAALVGAGYEASLNKREFTKNV